LFGAQKAEESVLLEAVAKEWLMKTLQSGKFLAGDVVNYKVQR
jgi:predicted Co/Zn/Cd cation transporter (cation efflux family)